MSFINWIKSLFEYSEDRCHNCGDKDDELNICQSCGKTTCDGCIADFVSGNCIDCEL